MIRFLCSCHEYTFELPDDMVGTMTQCPHCRRLVDVPTIDELARIEQDGSYRLGSAPETTGAPTGDAYIERVIEIYGGAAKHEPGDPVIDLRQTIDDVRRAGFDPSDIGPTPPHYDPLTGELIRPVDVKPHEVIDPATVPTAMAMARPRRKRGQIEPPAPHELLHVWAKVLRPGNLVVLGFFLLGQLFALVFALFTEMGMIFMLLPWLGLQGLLLAHFSSVVDEMGPTEGAELPAPIRGLSWHEDTGGPFLRFCEALGVSFGASALTLMFGNHLPRHIQLAMAAALAIAGALLFPAALLTSTTSGSLVNLRPDRLMGTIAVCMVEYPLLLITGILALVLYLAGINGQLVLASAAAHYLMGHAPLTEVLDARMGVALLALPVLLAGTYLMHVFCWQLGLVYRKHHVQFPWMHQRFHGKGPSRFNVMPPGAAPAPMEEDVSGKGRV